MPITYIKSKNKKPNKPVKTKATVKKAQLKTVSINKDEYEESPPKIMVRIFKINRWIFELERTETDKKLSLSLSAKKMVLLVLANAIDKSLRTTHTIRKADLVRYSGADNKTLTKALESLATDEIIEALPDKKYKINYTIEHMIKGLATDKDAIPLAMRVVNYNRSLFFSKELGYKIKATERLLLIGLVDRTKKSFKVRTPVSVITKKTGLSSETQNKAVSELIDRGLLNTYSCKEGEDSKKMVTTTYRLGTELMELWEKKRKQSKANKQTYKENYGKTCTNKMGNMKS